MAGRIALLIGTGSFRDPSLPQLASPAADVGELAALLRDPYIAGFDPVIDLVDASMQQVGREIARTLDRRKKDDLVVVYYSGQVLLDDEGRLHLAMVDTELDLLSATSISANFIATEMDRSRSRRQLLILDCRMGTGFAHGALLNGQLLTGGGQIAAALPSAQDLAHAFAGSGHGRLVSAACEPGVPNPRRRSAAASSRALFTQALLAGMKGAADSDQDGKITLDELYDYAHAEFVVRAPALPPGRFGDLTGTLPLAYSQERASRPPKAAPGRSGPQVGTLVSDRYRLTAPIESGAMFAAIDERTGRHVTVKCLRPPQSIDATALERFLRDAQTAGSIDHPNVVAIYDVGFEGNSAFIVMEPLEGETLAALLQHKPRLDIAEALEIVLPALAGVAAAHDHHVVHRALTPDTIFVNRHPAGTVAGVKVLGFGVSTVDDAAATRHENVIASPQYLAPEQVLGDEPIDARTDVYAFGAILYEALTGHRPFEADNHAAALWKLGNGKPRSLRSFCPTLPVSLESIVLQAMAKDPAERHASVEALRVALQRAVHEHGWMLTAEVIPAAAPVEVRRSRPSAPPMTIETPAVFERPRKAPPSRSFSWAFGVSLVAVALGLAGWLLSDPDLFEDEPPVYGTGAIAQPVETPPPEPVFERSAPSFEPAAPLIQPQPIAPVVQGTLAAPPNQPLSPSSAANLMIREVDAGWISPVPRSEVRAARASRAEARAARKRERELRRAGLLDAGTAR